MTISETTEHCAVSHCYTEMCNITYTLLHSLNDETHQHSSCSRYTIIKIFTGN